MTDRILMDGKTVAKLVVERLADKAPITVDVQTIKHVRRTCTKCSHAWTGEVTVCPACGNPYARVSS